ncbi:hypothetical protein LSAT2_030026 [Lamellibrachia satsuma]|nr:hypothetical protein LSAT2_030026 [Lamellibrachia satsuma]
MIAAPATQHVIVASQEGMYPNYAKSSSMCLGIFHLIISAVLFAISIAAVAILNNYGSTKRSMVSTLVFTVLYVAAGICAIVAGRNQKRSVVIAYIVLSLVGSDRLRGAVSRCK